MTQDQKEQFSTLNIWFVSLWHHDTKILITASYTRCACLPFTSAVALKEPTDWELI